MDIEEHGAFYIERKTVHHPVAGEKTFFQVGNIVPGMGYKPSADAGFPTIEEARQYIEKMQRRASQG
jgi:hypothetical protein